MFDKNNLPLRLGVGIILINDKNKIFVGKRIDNPVNLWQMPQGGVDKGEKLKQAALRELEEETGINKVKIVGEIENWLEYELPKNLLGKIWKGEYRGQKQKWFIMKFLGNNQDINIKTKKPEFIDWKWVEIIELPKIVVNFKIKVYEKIVKELKNFKNIN